MADIQYRNGNQEGKNITNEENKVSILKGIGKEQRGKSLKKTRKKRSSQSNMNMNGRNGIQVKRRKIWRKVMNLRRSRNRKEGKTGKMMKIKKNKLHKLKKYKSKQNKYSSRIDCTISGLLDNTKLYRKYNNQQRQIIRMLGKSAKAESKANKSVTAFQRLLQAIRNTSASNNSCPGTPFIRETALNVGVLEACNVTASKMCSEAVLNASDVSDADNCLTQFKSFIAEYDVSSISHNQKFSLFLQICKKRIKFLHRIF